MGWIAAAHAADADRSYKLLNSRVYVGEADKKA